MDRGYRARIFRRRSRPAEADDALARIAALSTMARVTWLGLLAYLAFVGITLLAVQDADFFVPSRQTQLPLIQMSIPTAAFFWFAPVLGAALYTYLHLQLIKLWYALAPPPEGPPPTVAGRPLGDRVYPWLINDLALSLRRDGAVPPRPLRWLASLVTWVLVWIAGPFVLAGFWWRSMPAHEEWLTLFLAVWLCLALYVGFTSWWTLANCMAGRKPPRRWFWTWRAPAGIAAALLVATLSWLRTEGGFDLTTSESTPLVRWALFAQTDLTGVDLVGKPSDWHDYETARSRFRATWCQREGLDLAICPRLSVRDGHEPEDTRWLRKEWCGEPRNLDDEACTERFRAFREALAAAWTTERGDTVTALPRLDLGGRDLRNAAMADVFLANADISGAQMEGAILRGAWLEGTYLAWARLVGADLREARMEGAYLGLAGLVGADLREARLEGAILRGASLKSAKWAGGTLRSPAHFADFRGGHGLTQAYLDGVIGNERTLLPEGAAPDTGEPFYVWSCWPTPPPGFDAMLQAAKRPGQDEADLKKEWLCPEGTAPKRTGTPLALDAKPPWAKE